MMVGLQTGGRRPKHDHSPLFLGTHDRDITGVVTWGFLLLVGMFMLFVDDDQSQWFHRGKYGTACTDHDASSSFTNLMPFIVTFPIRKMTVQHRHRRRMSPS